MSETKGPSDTAFDSIVGNLFYGETEEGNIFPFPHFSDDQKEMAIAMIDAIARYGEEKIDGMKMDADGLIPEEVIKGLAEMGLCGLAVPEEYGGMELDYSLYARIFGEIAGIDGSVATMLGAHQSIGYRVLLDAGTDEQKAKWLPQLASGEMFASFCLTEPGSGSDAYSIKTKAVPNENGDFIINGQKLWITNAGMAKFYTVFCKTDHEKNGKIIEKISCFIVEGDCAGLSFGEKENKMGIRASETRAIFFDNVVVPKENLIGELGKGFKLAMNVLNSGRLSLGAGCVGAMKSIIKLATDHAVNRKQFGMAISEFGMIQEKLARLAMKQYVCESVVYMTTGNMIKGMNDSYLDTAVCKVYCSEGLWEIVDIALQVAGGNGYMKEYPYERIMRDSRINLIFEGTNEILRCFLALSGVRGPSVGLKALGKATDVASALQDPIKSLGVLTDFAKKRISKMISTRSLTCVHEKLEDEAQELSSMISGFSIQVENTLMKYGKKIIEHELPQKRIANMVMELYAMLATFSRTTSILNDQSCSEKNKEYILNLTKLAFIESKKTFIANLKSMSKNEDKLIAEISQSVCENGGVLFDITQL